MPVEVNLVTNNNVQSDQHITRGIRPIEDIRVSKVLYASKDKPDLPVATSSSTIEKTHKELKVGQLVLEHPQKFVTSNEKVVSVLPEVKPAEGGEVGYCWTGPLSNDHNKKLEKKLLAIGSHYELLSLPSSTLESIMSAEESRTNQVSEMESAEHDAKLTQQPSFAPVDISRLLDDNAKVHETTIALSRYRKGMIVESNNRMKSTRQSREAISRYIQPRSAEERVYFSIKHGLNLSEQDLVEGMNLLMHDLADKEQVHSLARGLASHSPHSGDKGKSSPDKVEKGVQDTLSTKLDKLALKRKKQLLFALEPRRPRELRSRRTSKFKRHSTSPVMTSKAVQSSPNRDHFSQSSGLAATREKMGGLARRGTVAVVESTPKPPQEGGPAPSSLTSPRGRKFTPSLGQVVESTIGKEEDRDATVSQESTGDGQSHSPGTGENNEEGKGSQSRSGGIQSRNQKAREARAEEVRAKAEAKRKKAIWKEKQRRIAAAVHIQRVIRGFMGRYEASKHRKVGVIKWFIDECKALGKMASVLQTFRARKRIFEKEMVDRAREAERKMMDMVSLRYGLVKETVPTGKYYSAGDDVHAEAGEAVLGEACPKLSRIQRERLVVERGLRAKLVERGAEMGLLGHKDFGDAAYIVRAREATKDARDKRAEIEESLAQLRQARNDRRAKTSQCTRKLEKAMRASAAARQQAEERSKDTFGEQHHKLPAKMSLWYEESDGLVYGNKLMRTNAHDGSVTPFNGEDKMWWDDMGWGPGGDEMQYNSTKRREMHHLRGGGTSWDDTDPVSDIDSPRNTTADTAALVTEFPHSPHVPLRTSSPLKEGSVREIVSSHHPQELDTEDPNDTALVVAKQGKGNVGFCLPEDTLQTRTSMSKREEPDTRLYLSSGKAVAAQQVLVKERGNSYLKSQTWFVELAEELHKYALMRGAVAALQVNRNNDESGDNDGGVPLGLVRLALCIAQSLREGVDFAALSMDGDRERASETSLALDLVCSCVLPAELSQPITVRIVRKFTDAVGVSDLELYEHLSAHYDSTVDLRGWRQRGSVY